MQVGFDMNWSALSAIISGVTLFGTVGMGGIMWGSLTERVKNLTTSHEDNRTSLADHEQRLKDAEVKVGRLQEWKEGYNAAAQVGQRVREI